MGELNSNATTQYNEVLMPTFENDVIKGTFSNNSYENDTLYFSDSKVEELLKRYKDVKINQMIYDIYYLIQQDDFVDGEMTKVELFMKNAYENNQLEYVLEALMRIYYEEVLNDKILEGILLMISSVPYEVVVPKGQIMAMGLLSNKSLAVRDRAIQCFERWDSIEGIDILKSLDCEPKWLQRYVEKVIMYIERDGRA